MKFVSCALFLTTVLLAGGTATAEDTPAADTPEASNDGMEGNVQFLIGQTYLDDVWKPLDRPVAFSVEVDFAPKSSPVHFALATSASGDSATVVTPYFGKLGEVAAGFIDFSAGFVWLPVKKSVVRPYLGAGATLLFAGVDSGANAWNGGDSDHSFGFYANAGVFFKVGQTFNVGFDGRLVRASNVDIVATSVDADYERLSFLFGFSWGD